MAVTASWLLVLSAMYLAMRFALWLMRRWV